MFGRADVANGLGWVHVLAVAGSASIRVVDGASSPFAYRGKVLRDSVLSIVVFGFSDPLRVATITIQAQDDGFQGEVRIELSSPTGTNMPASASAPESLPNT